MSNFIALLVYPAVAISATRAGKNNSKESM